MRIVNVTDKQAEYVHDSCHETLEPGEIRDVPDWIGRLAIKQNAIMDTTYGDDGHGLGEPTGDFRIKPVGDVDAARMRSLMRFKCPLVDVNQCKAAPFDNLEAYTEHMMTHAGPPAPPPPTPLNMLKNK